MKRLLFIMCLLPTLGWSATLTSSVDRNQITINDMLQFQLRYDDQIATDQLDVSALQEDWEILDIRPQSSSSMQIINGTRTQEALTIWAITLAPRKQGALIIPPLTVDGVQSQAINVQVNEQGTVNPVEQPMRVTIDAQPQNAVVDQQVIVTIELSLLGTAQISNLGGEELKLADAQIELLAEDNLTDTDNGIERRILRWTYAMFPQQEGELVIPQQIFSGIIPARQRLGPFDPFGQRGQRVSARSDRLTINVTAAKETERAIWFPADSVRIDAYWGDPTRQLRVGEPLTRTVEITALGQRAELIPPLTASATTPQNYKRYQDQPQLETQVVGDSLIGVRRESQVIVPSVAGPLNLSAQTVVWWNTQTRQWDETQLEPEIVGVLPAADTTIDGITPPAMQTNTPASNTSLTTVMSGAQNQHMLIWQIAVIALLTITLIQAWFLYRHPTINSTRQAANDADSENEQQALNRLLKALDSTNPNQIRESLLNWSRYAFPNQSAHTSDTLAAQNDSEAFKQALRALDRSIYSDGQESFDRDVIKTSVWDLRNKTLVERSKQKNQALAPLYPI